MILTRQELLEHLASLGIRTSTIDHPARFTVEDSRRLRGPIVGAHTKNLLVRDKKGRVFLVVAEEGREVDLKSLHRRIGARGRLSFASPETMRQLLGVEPGSVTAFGLVNDTGHQVTLVLDATLMAHDMLNCHPLTNQATTTIARDDLLKFFAATGHEPLVTGLEAVAGERQENGPEA